MTKVLITGILGFIGSNLAKKLIEKGFTVIGIDVKIAKQLPYFNFFNVDLSQLKLDTYRKLDRIFRGFNPDVVIHCASKIDVEESFYIPEDYIQNNVISTTLITKYCSNYGVKLIFTSSIAVYGKPKYLPIDENHPLEPINPYGLSKKFCEEVIQYFFHYYNNFKYVILRLSNVYGFNCHGVIHKFITKLIKNGIPIIYGDGNQTRDFIYIDDVCELILKIIEVDGFYNTIVNVGFGKSITINELFEKIKTILNKNIKPIYEPERSFEIKKIEVNINKVKTLYNWQPKIDLDTGLKLTIEQYLKSFS